MESLRLDPVFSLILRASLAALFATAAIHKIRDPGGFLRTFSDYEILPGALVPPAAVALVVAEASTALALLIRPADFAAASAAISLLLIYSLAISANLVRGRREIDCGCLGPANRQPLSPWLLFRNGTLAMGAAASGWPTSGRSLHFLDGISLLGGFLTLVLLFNATNLLAARTWLRPELERIR